MNNTAKEMFSKLKETQNPSSEYDFVFATSGGKPNSERNMRRALNSIQEVAHLSVQNSGLHILRHSFVSLMIRNGADVKEVSEAIGHQSITLTLSTYHHLLDKQKRKSVMAY